MATRVSIGIAAIICLLSPRSSDAGEDAHGPLRISESRADGSVTSPNWSGYAVTGKTGSVSAVLGSWVVPQAACGGSSPKNTGASHWIGIDGYTSRTVEQTGTDSDCANGTPNYYAWYELYPSPGITIHALSVAAGDIIDASVVYAGGQFVITITDERTQQTFTTAAPVANARRDSAEWIVEDNSTNFTDFGNALFGQDQTGISGTCSVGLDGANPVPIGHFGALQGHAITMADTAGTVMAVPSALSADGTSFSVAWQAVR